MIKAKPVTDKRLKSLADRINRLMDERDGLGSDIRDVFAEAKSAGYIPKVLRKAITRQRMDANTRSEEDSILALYDEALGNVGAALEAISNGATWEEAGKDHGVKRATLARAAAVSKRREMIPDTLEAGAPNPVRDGEASADERDASASSSPPDRGERAAPLGAKGPALSCTLTDSTPAASIPAEPDLTLPSFLDRRVAA